MKEDISKKEISASQAKRKKKRKAAKHRLNIERIVLLIILSSLIFTIATTGINLIKLKNQQVDLLKQQEELEAEKEKLTDDLKNVNTKEYVEREARDKLRMIKPGETLFIIEKSKNKE